METSLHQRVSLAQRLVATDPQKFGGILFKAHAGAQMDSLRQDIAKLAQQLNILHPSTSIETLCGGADPIASLTERRLVMQSGVLDRAGWFLAPMFERLRPDLAAVIAQRMDQGTLGPLFAFDEGETSEASLALSVESRLAFCFDLREVSLAQQLRFDAPLHHSPKGTINDVQVDPTPLVYAALQLGISDLRPVIMAQQAARYFAAWNNRTDASQEDLELAASLVFTHRANHQEEAVDQSPPSPEQPNDRPNSESENLDTQPPLPQDLIIDAIKAALPEGLLNTGTTLKSKNSQSKGAGFGVRQKTQSQGRPLPSIAGGKLGQDRIDIIASLRSAAPWQKIRRKHIAHHSGPIIFPRDLKFQRFENRTERVMIFVVDASGSAALSRLGEAKGAVELMLAQAYSKRDFVALIGFRDSTADVLLPPTRSLVQTKRKLGTLAAGGGTPLATGLETALKLALRVRQSGKLPTLAFLTDGKGNIDLAGTAGRDQAMKDAQSIARQARHLAIPSIFIDSGRRSNPKLVELAKDWDGTYLCLPRPDAQGLSDIAQSHMS